MKLTVTLALLVAPVAASAQIPYYPPIGVWQGNMMFNAQRTAEHFAPIMSKAPADEPAVARAAVAKLTYTPSPARTRANIAAFAAKSRAVDPQGAAAMETLFASSDVMATVETGMRGVGLTRTNVADAYTMWWTAAWLATQGRNDDLPSEQLQAVKRQTVAALGATPEFAAATDAQKQEFAESFLVQAMLIGASVDMAREQPALMVPLKAAVSKGAKASGLDLSAMTLTPQGFRTVAR